MTRIVRAFGTSHSAMLMAELDNWIDLFDHIDRRAPIHDFEGVPRSYEELLEPARARTGDLLSREEITNRFSATQEAMERLRAEIASARLDALIVIGDDQNEIFKSASRPAIAIFGGAAIRNAAAPASIAPGDWYTLAQSRRLEPNREAYYPCHDKLAVHLIESLTTSGFDLTALMSLDKGTAEGHAYSFIHRRYMNGGAIPMVPIFLNTYYAPNRPTPARCLELGRALRDAVNHFPGDLRVGVMASGGLSHFLVNERLDQEVIECLRRKDIAYLATIDPVLLQSGSSEIRNWICTAQCASELELRWLNYIPAYRSRALTGVGLCFASWE